MTTTIHHCTERDAAELENVARQSFKDAFEKVNEPTAFEAYVAKAFDPSVILEELRHEATHFYFLKNADGETVGYLKLRWDRSEEFFPTERALELQRIYLLEKHWNKGYGATLLEFAEGFGRTNGFAWIWLVVWFENHGAIRFYEKQGWEKFARKEFHFGSEIHNDYVLRKKLH